MSNIIIAAEGDAERLDAATDASALTRAERRTMEKQAMKAAGRAKLGPNTAVTYGTFPRLLSQALSAAVVPRLSMLNSGLADLVMEMQAVTDLLVERGIITVEDIAARRAALEAEMKALHEANVKAQQEQQPPAVNEQSPAFQEATEQAKGAPVKRLDEGITASVGGRLIEVVPR